MGVVRQLLGLHDTLLSVLILKKMHTYVCAMHVVSSPLRILTAVHATKVGRSHFCGQNV